MSDDTKWALFVGATTMAASLAARELLSRSWARARGRSPDDDPGLRETGMVEAMAWSMAVAGGAGLARLLARRGATAVWRRTKSEDPPPVV